jgi:hypothetical protein
MKKVILLSVIIFVSFSMNAQVEPQAIGIRFGGGNLGSGMEINYLHGIGDLNRAEVGLGINSFDGSSFLNVAGVYQWVFDLEQGFSWYTGPGAQLLLIKNSSSILVGGEVGVEYNFNSNLDTPLRVALDTRPMFNLGNGANFGWGIRLSAHYTF